MQFYDRVQIKLVSGDGGDGCVSGRREAGVPYGGPSGGNGGKGGSIILQADKNLNTLVEYQYKKKFKAKDGEPGRSKEQYGANGEDLVLKIPVGTTVIDADTGDLLYYFKKHGQQHTIVQGGEGGLGNIEFKSPTLQYPNFATLGEPGNEYNVILELQLLGDVALIGSPSVGKSTFINSVSNTKAKVADYHFTTLVPHLGSVKVNDFSYNIVDVPGLIKGASQGKGLGNEFLRHILKAKVFCMMTDIYRFNQGIDELLDLFIELLLYIKNRFSQEDNIGGVYDDLDFEITNQNDFLILSVRSGKDIILEKVITFVLNKIDLLGDDDEILQEYMDEMIEKLKSMQIKELGGIKPFANLDIDVLKKHIYPISSATHIGVQDLIKLWADILENKNLITIEQEIQAFVDKDIVHKNTELIKEITDEEKEILIQGEYITEEEADYLRIWEINDREFCKIVFTVQRGNEQGEMHFWHQIEQAGYLESFIEAGAMKGDIFKVKSYYKGHDDKYIQW